MQNFKAVHSFIIFKQWATFVPISAFLLFVVSTVVHGEECALFHIFWPLFTFFWQILPQLKTFSKNLSACIILILDAAFVLNLTFLGILSYEILLGEKVFKPDTQLILPSMKLSAQH